MLVNIFCCAKKCMWEVDLKVRNGIKKSIVLFAWSYLNMSYINAADDVDPDK